MSRQVNQDVGSVSADHPLDVRVELANEIPPDGREGPEPAAGAVLAEVIVEKQEVELHAVEVPQKRLEEAGAGMGAQVWGQDAETQAAGWFAATPRPGH